MEGVSRPFDARRGLAVCRIPVESVPGPVKRGRVSKPRFIMLQSVIKGDPTVGMIGISDQEDKGLWVDDS